MPPGCSYSLSVKFKNLIDTELQKVLMLSRSGLGLAPVSQLGLVRFQVENLNF